MTDSRDVELPTFDTRGLGDHFIRLTLDLFCVADVEGNFHWVNPAWSQVLGWSEAELLGQPYMNFVHDEDVPATVAAMARIQDGGRVHAFRNRYRRRNGGFAWLEWNAEADPAGRFVYAIARDVTEHVEAERKRAASMNMLEMAEGLAHVGHWYVDLASGRPYWSAEVFRIHGLDPSAFAPDLKSAINAYHPEDRVVVERAIADAVAKKTGFDFELRLVRPSGEVRFVEASGLTELDDSGEVRAIFGVFSDVTERKAHENRLRDAIATAEAAASTKADFLANMSHEIRTPLNGVIGMSELLLDTPLQPAQREYVDAARAAGEHLKSLVDGILDLSKLEAQRLVLDSSPVSLRSAAELVVKTFTLQARAKGITVRYEIQGAAHAVMGDEVRIKQILLNLVGNAVKFTDRGEVVLTIRTCVNSARFEVRDTGIGISAEDRDRLFERFSQAETGKRRRHGGTGLGLALCRELVALMQGTIGVESTPGSGSTFWVELPLPEASIDLLADTEEPPPCPPRHVLVAEDNATNQLLIRRLLERRGHTVHMVEDGVAAVSAALDHRFDMVLMDLHMPLMDGVEAARRIRSTDVDVPIFALTATTLAEDRHRVTEAGMTGYLTKPIQISELEAALRADASDPKGTAPQADSRNAS